MLWWDSQSDYASFLPKMWDQIEEVAAIAQAFGCEVLAYSRTKKDVPGIAYTDLDTLLSQCDIVSLHTPLNDSTRGLIGKEHLALMKKNAVLINTARGPVVDSQALAEALKLWSGIRSHRKEGDNHAVIQ